MRALVCRTWGPPSGLVMREVPSPALAPGQVRIRVAAAGVNFADTLMIAGTYQTRPPFPFSPGLEASGEVVETSAGVDRVWVGDRVMAMVAWGAYAEEVVADARDVYPVPAGMDLATAAGFPVAYATSHYGLKRLANVDIGETVLINGAAGGVGLTAVEIARASGATVIAVASGPARAEIAREHGANHVVDHRAEDVRERIKALTGGRGVDLVYDPVGGPAFDAGLRAIVPGGRILAVGFASGTVPQIPANILLVKNVTVIGFSLSVRRAIDRDGIDRTFADLARLYAAGCLRPRIDRIFPLAEGAAALEALLARRIAGKAVLVVKAS